MYIRAYAFVMIVVCSCIQIVFILLYAFRNMKGKGHRRLRLCSNKNYERKKYASKSRNALQDVSLSLNVQQPSIEPREQSVLTNTELNSKLQQLDSLNGTYIRLHEVLVSLCIAIRLDPFLP